MSLAPVAYLLFQKVMRHNPADPEWVARDRFVLSCGHSSITLYTQLFLGGFGLELDDLKALRTWGSKTPGHPELGHTAGVEVTTGPLGQGVGNAVGMALSGRRVHGLLDPDAAPGESLFDHQVYVIASDGDLEEGVSSEASSIAGTQQLGNLTMIYDRNRISIEGDTDIAFTEDVAARYEAYGWHVQTVDWTNGGKDVRRGRPRALRRDPQGPRRRRPAVADRPRHRHRLARAQRAGHRGRPRQRARRRRGRRDQGGPRLRPRADLRGPAGRPRAHPRAARARRGVGGGVGRAVRRVVVDAQEVGRAAPPPRASRDAHRPRRRAADVRRRREGRRHAVRVGQGHQRPRPGAARAVGRFGRPGRLQQHDHHQRPVRRPRGRRGRRVEHRPATPAASCTSASASTAWARS